MCGEESQKRPRGRPRLDDQLVPRILDAAERLFAEHGPVNVSIRDIAAEAGLPHSAIYRYFDSKDEVLRQVLIRGRDPAARARGRGAAGRAHHRGRPRLDHGQQPGLHPLGGAPRPRGRDHVVARHRPRRDGRPADARGSCEDGYPFELRTDHDPQMVVAAVMALTIGWVTAEEWIIDAVGMHGCDHARSGRASTRSSAA